VTSLSVGIDLGASAIDVTVLQASEAERPVVRAARTFHATDFDGVVTLVTGATEVAIDAPAQLSTAPHRGDGALSPKFRTARCGEIALGEQAGIWVPWVTPADATKVPGWIQVGFDLWSALRAAGHEPIEVYPAGVFRVLAGRVPPRKTSRAGRLARVELLADHVELPPAIDAWSHDGIDALGAALTAHQKVEGRAREVGHEASSCDGSSIWLPGATAAPQ
jgi:hypothetical protein